MIKDLRYAVTKIVRLGEYRTNVRHLVKGSKLVKGKVDYFQHAEYIQSRGLNL